MAQTKIDSPTNVVERNILLTGKIMQFLMDEPRIFDSLPEDFELVILPDDDPAIRQYNLELLDSYASEDKPIVTATMFGVTTPCVEAARRAVEAAGFEVLVFHATGSGGRTMEGLVRDGLVSGVLDLTTTELADELAVTCRIVVEIEVDGL